MLANILRGERNGSRKEEGFVFLVFMAIALTIFICFYFLYFVFEVSIDFYCLVSFILYIFIDVQRLQVGRFPKKSKEKQKKRQNPPPKNKNVAF